MVQEGSGPLKGKGTLLTACSRVCMRLERAYSFQLALQHFTVQQMCSVYSTQARSVSAT